VATLREWPGGSVIVGEPPDQTEKRLTALEMPLRQHQPRGVRRRTLLRVAARAGLVRLDRVLMATKNPPHPHLLIGRLV
jgi:hypothetical protein